MLLLLWFTQGTDVTAGLSEKSDWGRDKAQSQRVPGSAPPIQEVNAETQEVAQMKTRISISNNQSKNTTSEKNTIIP